MKEIGSIFPITFNNEITDANKCDIKNIHYYSLGREALIAIAKQCKKLNKRILLPAYTCDSVVKPFIQEQWEVYYYNINKKLRIDADDILKKTKQLNPSLCLFHPFFGCGFLNDEVEAIKEVKKSGCGIIEDLTQSLFLNQDGIVFDYYVASLRKWFAIPDGALLVANIEKELYPVTGFDEYSNCQYKAMTLRGQYFQIGNEETKAESIAINKYANRLADENPISLHKISEYSLNVLQYTDLLKCQVSRIENYTYLFNRLPSTDKYTKVMENIADLKTAPLYFPIYAENPEDVQRYLAQNKVYAPLLWSANKKNLTVSPDAEYIYEHILVIPCDQRYNVDDMSYVVVLLSEYDLK